MEERKQMLATPKSEHRTDRAELELGLADAPVMRYTHRSWRSRVDAQERSWQPDRATIIWDTGVLTLVRVYGHRVKKDGTPGVLRESYTYRVDSHGMVTATTSDDFQYPTEWVQKLIDIYAECPKQAAPGRLGRSESSQRVPAHILLPAE